MQVADAQTEEPQETEQERIALHAAPAARDFERAVFGPFRYTVGQHPEGSEGRRA